MDTLKGIADELAKHLQYESHVEVHLFCPTHHYTVQTHWHISIATKIISPVPQIQKTPFQPAATKPPPTQVILSPVKLKRPSQEYYPPLQSLPIELFWYPYKGSPAD